MNSFTLHLQSATQYERIENVVTFVGEDESGSFGILADHERMMTALRFGLARFRRTDGNWEYLALPGGLVHLVGNELFVNTRRYVRDPDCSRITRVLDEQLRREETDLHGLKQSLQRLEEEMFKRLWRLGRGREL